MRFILRQLAITATCLVGLYLFGLALSFLIYPSDAGADTRDVGLAGGSLYMTEPRFAFLNIQQFKAPGRKLIVLGASNAGYAFRAKALNAAIPCASVYDYAIGGANISQVAETADLISGTQDTAGHRDDLFVVGVWYGMFADSATHWHIDFRQPGDTDLDLELYRYGFYHRGPNGPVANVPASLFDAAVVAIRPYLAIERLTRDVTASLRHRFLKRQPVMTDAEREGIVVTDTQRKIILADWQQSMGNTSEISAAQTKLFGDMVKRLLLGGSKVIVLDLPLPHWHEIASPYYLGYQNMLSGLQSEFKSDSAFTFMQMKDLNADSAYSDEVHPKPHLAAIWRQRLAEVASPMLCKSTGLPPQQESRAN
jgi:hypothetical protein